MTTMTEYRTTIEQDADGVSADPGSVDRPTLWHVLAIVATIGAAALIALTRDVDRCADPRSMILIVSAWLIAPIVAIASTTVVATLTDDDAERAVTAAVGLVMAIGWLYAIHWMALGAAIEGMGC